MNLLATPKPAGLLGLELPAGAAVRIAPEALVYCDASIKIRRQWKQGFFRRLTHLLSGEEVFHSAAVNTGPDPAHLELSIGLYGFALEVFFEKHFLWNAQAFVCASSAIKSTVFFKKRLQSGLEFVLEKSHTTQGVIHLRSDYPVKCLTLEAGQSVYVNPQAFLAASFPTRLSLQRALQSHFMLQLWGPSTVYLCGGGRGAAGGLRRPGTRPWTRK